MFDSLFNYDSCVSLILNTFSMPRIENVKFSYPATIVFWSDGTKTVVKCGDGDTYDEEKGLAMAICKKVYGNKGNFNNEFKKWLQEVDNDGRN